MKSSEVKGMTSEELIRVYENAAMAHGEATDNNDPIAANKAADLIATIYRELRQRGTGAQSLLLPLLESSHPSVRGWAGAHALEFLPSKGIPTLEALAKEPRWPGFDAKMTLRVWREGKLRFP